MPTDRYYFDEGTLDAKIGGTTVPIAEVRNVDITPAAQHNRFYGPDSIEFQDVKRSEFAVNVDIEMAEFNEDWVQYWLDGTGSTATSPNDNNDVAQFNLTAEQPMTSGDFKLQATVNNTDFPEMPAIVGTEGEYISHSMTGTGQTMTYSNVTA